MRLLVDNEGLKWDQAWELTTASTGYTNHTILPEAMEKWPVDMMERLLPRHLQIIYEINARFLRDVALAYPFDTDRLARMSIVEEAGQKYIRMAHLAIVGSCSVNGVSQLHTDLLQTRVLRDFADYYPRKINNKTNGITPRRWLLKANPPLARLITETIGKKWIVDLDELRKLDEHVNDPVFRNRFQSAKQVNKITLSRFVAKTQGITISPDSLFDVQVKRIHEYKRQLMLALYIIVLYNRVKSNPNLRIAPRTFLIGGKAAPGYALAKLIIKLINQISETINGDRRIDGLIKVVFLPNYRVSLAEKIIPAADLSEQISTAGTEASGTGNMKLQLNGALTIGTLDGANVEILKEVGRENIFIFGMTAEEVEQRRAAYDPWAVVRNDAEIERAIHMIEQDFFNMMERGIFGPLLHSLFDDGDRYMVLADLRAYIEAQDKVDAVFQDREEWTTKAIINVARAGKFSSDRTIREYASQIWHVEPVEVAPFSSFTES
jgi:starch phosphorylase